jgi:hypothetical protein
MIKDREDFVIYVVATLTIKPETRAELMAAARTCIGITRRRRDVSCTTCTKA